MIEYPAAPQDATVETLHGTPVADPYRWLEDPDSAATTAFTAEQNALAEPYLRRLPGHAWFTAHLDALHGAPRAGTPWLSAGRYLRFTRAAGAEQDLLLVAGSLAELLGGGRVLIDPEAFGEAGAVSLSAASVSPDGRLLGYALNRSGSDWQSIRVRDIDSGEDLSEEIEHAKFTSVCWLPDSTGFIYRGYPDQLADGRSTEALGAGTLLIHRLGTPQSEDLTLWHDPAAPRDMADPEFTADDTWLLLTVSEGTSSNSRLYARRVLPDGAFGPQLTVFGEATDRRDAVEAHGDLLYLLTDADAPNGALAAVDLAAVERGEAVAPRTVAAEQEHALEFAAAADEGFLLVHLVDAAHRVTRIDAEGRELGTLALGERVSVTALDAKKDRAEAFVGTSTFLTPSTSHRLNASTGETAPLADPPGTPEAPKAVALRRTAISRDGTEVRYTLLRPSAAAADAPLPTLLYGYGGFNISQVPAYRPIFASWVSAGGAVAVANLRGGAENGRDWHEAGMLDRKQNVFDDFAAVAEHLAETGAADAGRLALHGGSNGGLLVGAVLTQRPELAAAAIPSMGVLDMLRFHRFTIGHAWVNEFGDPDDAEEFRTLLAYSPLHNTRPGTAYPATLIATADHDDRVVPAHSYKFAAALQAAQAGGTDAQPILLRAYGDAGHGQQTRRSTLVAQNADVLSFAAAHTGLRP